MKRNLPDFAECLEPDFEAGTLTWKKTVSSGAIEGDLAGCVGTNGRASLGLNGSDFYVHHVIWYLAKGDWPDELDHKDGDPLNNSLDNLRLCNSSQNKMNRKKALGKTSTWKGVSWDGARGKWMAQIKAYGKKHHLGRFDDEKEAAEEYMFAALRLHGEFARFD